MITDTFDNRDLDNSQTHSFRTQSLQVLLLNNFLVFVLMYDINCPGSKAYASLAAELLQQENDNL